MRSWKPAVLVLLLAAASARADDPIKAALERVETEIAATQAVAERVKNAKPADAVAMIAATSGVNVAGPSVDEIRAAIERGLQQLAQARTTTQGAAATIAEQKKKLPPKAAGALDQAQRAVDEQLKLIDAMSEDGKKDLEFLKLASPSEAEQAAVLARKTALLAQKLDALQKSRAMLLAQDSKPKK